MMKEYASLNISNLEYNNLPKDHKEIVVTFVYTEQKEQFIEPCRVNLLALSNICNYLYPSCLEMRNHHSPVGTCFQYECPSTAVKTHHLSGRYKISKDSHTFKTYLMGSGAQPHGKSSQFQRSKSTDVSKYHHEDVLSRFSKHFDPILLWLSTGEPNE